MTELAEAALEVLIQEGVEYGVQAAVDIAERNAEMHQDQYEQATQVEAQRLSEDHDLDGCPTDDECSHHHQDHPSDATQVTVLFFGARQDANTAQTLDHQAVADADNSHRDEEGKEKDTGAEYRIPVTPWFRQNHNAINT